MAKIAEFYAELGLKKDKFDKGMKDAGKAPANLSSVFKTLGPAIAGAFSVAAISMFTKASLEAYDAQAKAEAGLLKALKGRKDIQQALIEQANQMQRTTLFEDDTIIQAQKFLATMGLSATMIHDMLPLLADFSTSTGMNLVEAANLAGKAIGTSTNALGRYGVELDSTMSKTEKASEIMAVFTERYGGQAKKAAEVGMSGLQQLNKAWGEIQEMVGAHIGPFLNAISTLLSKELFDVGAGDKKNDAVNEFLEATLEGRERLLKGYEESLNEYLRLTDKFRGAQKGTEQYAKYEHYSAESDKVRELIQALKDLSKTGQAVNEDLETTGKVLEKLPDPTELATSSIYKYIEALEAAKFALKDFNAIAQNDAIKTHASKLPGLEDEPNVADGIDTEAIVNQYKALQDETALFVDGMNASLEALIEQFIISFSDGIADIITGDGGFSELFDNILGSMGSFLQQMGAGLVAYGVSIKAFKSALSNPVAAVVAGAALIITGGIISNLAAKGPEGSTVGMAGGGGISGSTGSQNNTGFGGSNDFRLTTEISGSDLQLVLERANRYSARGGRG